MKAYIASILIIGLALGGMGLGTFAWFTSSGEVRNNVIETGNVKLEVTGTAFNVENLVPTENPEMLNGFSTEEAVTFVRGSGWWQWPFPFDPPCWWPFTGSNPVDDNPAVDDNSMWSNAGSITLENSGSVPLKWKGCFVLANEAPSEPPITVPPMSEKIWFKIVPDLSESGEGALYTTWAAVSSVDVTENPLCGIIDEGESLTLDIQVKLDENAGNIYAGKKLTFDAVFDATQLDNDGWTEDGQ